MTLVACWATGPRELYCATDSRLTNPESSVLTETGAKLFIVPVRCQYIGHAARKKDHTYTLGFAFAGSSLLANNAHALASTLTQQIVAKKAKQIPSVRTIANIYAECAKHVISDLNFRLHDKDRKIFGGFIFGYCPVTKNMCNYAIKPIIDESGFKVVVSKEHGNEFFINSIGSGADGFMKIATKTDESGHLPNTLHMFRDYVEGGQDTTVGGNVQLAIADKNGVEIVPIIKRGFEEPNDIVLTVNGLNISRTIDGFNFGAKAISYEPIVNETWCVVLNGAEEPITMWCTGTNYAPQACASLRSVYHMLVPLRWSRDHGVRAPIRIE